MQSPESLTFPSWGLLYLTGECIANKQAYDSPLPPFKRRKTEIVHLSDISPNLWTFEQPWTPVPFNNTSAGVRMVVYRLGDDADSLLVCTYSQTVGHS